ncbi:hypothetical protein ACFL2M_02205 [Patescibacteria group bacterium]
MAKSSNQQENLQDLTGWLDQSLDNIEQQQAELISWYTKYRKDKGWEMDTKKSEI